MKLFENLPRYAVAVTVAAVFVSSAASAALLTDPNDSRNWQGATVGTFAALYYGSDTLANRQLVVDNALLDDGLFQSTGTTPGTMVSTVGVPGVGMSHDTTGTGSYSYGYAPAGTTVEDAGNSIDNLWIQTDHVIGHAVWDLGAASTKAAIFNTIDHGPLPQEAIESTVYLSNDATFSAGSYVQAVTERVWLEGFMENTSIVWDGFAYAVGTGTGDEFRYLSIIWGGPGALIADGDNEINGVLGLNTNFTPSISAVPLPATLPLFLSGLFGIGVFARRKRT